MQKVAICKVCGATFLQKNRKHLACSLPCRKELADKRKAEKTPQPARKIETIKDCKHENCRYRGKIGTDECCDYCFITGKLRGCKISECTHALEKGESRQVMIKKMKQKGIF